MLLNARWSKIKKVEFLAVVETDRGFIPAYSRLERESICLLLLTGNCVSNTLASSLLKHLWKTCKKGQRGRQW